MRTDKLKKYILRAAPYLPVFWTCLKVGTAYRLEAGANFAQKLVGMLAAIGPAFANFAPGLHWTDWLVGLTGAAALRAFLYVKVKNAKKYRRDEEYGSARWGEEHCSGVCCEASVSPAGGWQDRWLFPMSGNSSNMQKESAKSHQIQNGNKLFALSVNAGVLHFSARWAMIGIQQRVIFP